MKATHPASTKSKFATSDNRFVDYVKKKFLITDHPLFLRLRQKVTGEALLNAETVSVIVPFYNVEQYIEAALDSLRYQRYRNLEIILIDDGSTDQSRKIAERYVEADERFTLLSTKNQGPGAARNFGLKHISGSFLCFVDADDIVPIGGIYKLVESLIESGSDFATGAYEHLHLDGRWKPEWVVQQHSSTRQGMTLEQIPGIVRNVFPWNKVFRTEFFRRHVQAFPEGIFYEDQVPIANAYVHAKHIDVIENTVYLWRKRQSGDSITQNRQSVEHLQNRFLVLEEVWDIYKNQAHPNVYAEWLKKSLFLDMLPFLDIADAMTPDYRSELFRICAKIANELAVIHSDSSECADNDDSPSASSS